ncbi:flavin reductase family protein [Deinococcus sp.]|uniref:flavin reductase family protein n=1 Tax=Deinococcus sp. TaxID=47478 RepID=UPI0025EC9C73|nr:flavin reductase family protein [Deinococcus sp.]
MTSSGISPHEFRQTLGRFASGVTVVSALHGGNRRGMTANAFVSVSLEPPLILVSVDKKASMHAVLEGAERFGVSVLSTTQQHLSDHFAGRPDAAINVPWFEHQGLPLLSGAVSQLVCRQHSMVDAGDHTLFFGEVEYSRYTDDDPLLYFRGQYHEIS